KTSPSNTPASTTRRSTVPEVAAVPPPKEQSLGSSKERDRERADSREGKEKHGHKKDKKDGCVLAPTCQSCVALGASSAIALMRALQRPYKRRAGRARQEGKGREAAREPHHCCRCMHRRVVLAPLC